MELLLLFVSRKEVRNMSITLDYKARIFDALYELKKENAELYIIYADRMELELFRVEQIDKLTGTLKSLKMKEQESRFRGLWSDLKRDIAEDDGI